MYLTFALIGHGASFVKVPAPPDGHWGPSEHMAATAGVLGGSGGKGLKTSFANDPIITWLKVPSCRIDSMHWFGFQVAVWHHDAVVYVPGAGVVGAGVVGFGVVGAPRSLTTQFPHLPRPCGLLVHWQVRGDAPPRAVVMALHLFLRWAPWTALQASVARAHLLPFGALLVQRQ